MYAAKALIGALVAGVAVLINALHGPSHTLQLVDYLMAVNATLVALVAVYLVPNKGTVNVGDIEQMITKAIAVYALAANESKGTPTAAPGPLQGEVPMPPWVQPPVQSPVQPQPLPVPEPIAPPGVQP